MATNLLYPTCPICGEGGGYHTASCHNAVSTPFTPCPYCGDMGSGHSTECTRLEQLNTLGINQLCKVCGETNGYHKLSCTQPGPVRTKLVPPVTKQFYVKPAATLRRGNTAEIPGTSKALPLKTLKPGPKLARPKKVSLIKTKKYLGNRALQLGSSLLTLLIREKYRCYYCGVELNNTNLTRDHKIPRSRGGTNDLSNLVACCSRCNTNKGDWTEEEFRAWISDIVTHMKIDVSLKKAQINVG